MPTGIWPTPNMRFSLCFPIVCVLSFLVNESHSKYKCREMEREFVTITALNEPTLIPTLCLGFVDLLQHDFVWQCCAVVDFFCFRMSGDAKPPASVVYTVFSQYQYIVTTHYWVDYYLLSSCSDLFDICMVLVVCCRSHAIACVNQFIISRTQALMLHIDPFIEVPSKNRPP